MPYVYDPFINNLVPGIDTGSGGAIPVPGGGTGRTSLTAHSVLLGEGTSPVGFAGPTAVVGQVLQSAGLTTDPAFSTASYPLTTTINQLLFSSAANTITGLATGNSGVLITSAGGVPSISSTLPSAVQGNITALGTIATGVWNGTIIGSTYGGTGVNNGTSTITIGGNLLFSGAFTTTITVTGTTSVTLPTSGTLATTSQLPTLPLSLANGGTGAAITASNGGIFYSNASTGALLSGTATAGQLLTSGASTTPAWTTSTYPATNAANTLLYASSANTMAALTSGNSLLAATNASGTLAMRAMSVVIQTFTSTTTYTPTTGMLYCIIECTGAGGGGGGGATTGATTTAGAGGGGSGEYARGVFSASAIGASQSVTVPAGGAGGTAGNNAGTGGSATSVGALISANGGSGGAGSAASATAQQTPGGTGGSGGSGGSVRTAGTSGGYGTTGAQLVIGGAGAPGQFSGGTNINNAAGAGTNSSGHGGGGQGASNNINTSATAGGNGTGGLIVVTEYVIN